MRCAAKTSELADTPPQQATATAPMCLVASDTPTLQAPHGTPRCGRPSGRQITAHRVGDYPMRQDTFSAAKAADRRACKCRVSGVSAICQWSEEGMSA